MPLIVQLLYFLFGEDEATEKAWPEVLSLYDLPASGTPFQAKGEDSSLELYRSGPVGVLEYSLLTTEWEKDYSLLREKSKTLDEKGIPGPVIGESFIFAGEGDAAFLPGKPVPTNINGSWIKVFLEADNPYKRYYVLDEEEKSALIKKWLPTVDMVLYRLQREIAFYSEQKEIFIKTRDELEKKSGEVLFKKGGKELKELEMDIEKVSSIYGVLANYRLLMREAESRIETLIEELEKSLEGVVPLNEGFIREFHLKRARDFILLLKKIHEDFALSLSNARSAIEVIKTRVELARGRESVGLQEKITSLMRQNVLLQEESLSVAIAASFVEFFIVLYYGLNVWKTLSGEEAFHSIPLSLKSGLIVLLSLLVVIGTHKSAKAIKENRYGGILPWALALVGVIVLMAAASAFYKI